MKVRIVIGANFGDEGKGTVVATYTKHSFGRVLNVLTNGGAQRAHSILTEDGSYTFQHFGSGTMYGADNYYSQFYILNPMQFVKEYEQLKPIGRIFRNPDCIWSTPYDMIANAIIEELRGSDKHGSCGMGIWETIQRSKVYNVNFDYFCNGTYKFRVMYLERIRKYYEMKIGSIPEKWQGIWNDPNMVIHFINDCFYLYRKAIPASFEYLIGPFGNYDEVIFENGQGLMLSDTGLDIPGTTPSFTGIRDSLDILNSIDQKYDLSVHYVTRPYLTRHGRGFLYKESNRFILSSSVNEDRTNHYNEFQDDFRYGFLEINELRDRIMNDFGNTNAKLILEVTHCDEMDRLEEFKKYFSNINTYDSALIK